MLRRMRERGIVPTVAGSVGDGLVLLAERDFDAVVADVDVEGGGTALIKWIKAGIGPVQAPLDAPEKARSRHARTPFFLFMDGTSEWAVVLRPPDHSYLEDGLGLQMIDAVANLDLGQLFLKGPPLA